ncbi:MAG TPA: glycosyltransferase family 1 protein [Polyangiaceae bacterium]|nr:glycosyltransferase family 1 protein [Polyangiaceae bacterium]
MTQARPTAARGRFVIDARYVAPKPSGIGRYAEALIERLPRLAQDEQFELWTHPERPQPVAFDNVRCLPLAAPADGLRTLLTPRLLGRLAPSDVIHFPFNLLGRGLPCATVVTIHDLMWLERPELVERRPLMRRVRQHYYQRGMRWALERATRLIAISEATRARMLAVAPECAERVRVTHNAADPRFAPASDAQLAAERAALILGSAAPFYLVVGKNEPYKGHDLAIEAFAQSSRDDELLVLIQRTSGAEGLEKLAERLGVTKRLRFLPVVTGEDLVSLLQAARALLQPSIVEGFGIPALEAMACGCPVIGSDTPALVEVLGGAGLHAKVGDARALGDALTRLRSDGLTADLRQRGLARARDFSWERTATATLEVYREAAAAYADRTARGGP